MAKQKPLSRSGLRGAAEEFANYCKAEFERRSSTGEPFDEDLHQEAMELVIKRLHQLNAEVVE